MNESGLNKKQATLIAALQLLLKPLIKLMIRQHLTFPMLRELLKKVYLEQATELIERDGESANFSRLFILTGVHRKDIKRLSETATDESAPSDNRSLGAQLIANWLALPEYRDEQGQPRPLAFNGNEKQPGFEQLVSQVSKDIRPRAMLDEWTRQGIVSRQDQDIVLNQTAFVPSDDFNRLCDYFGTHIHDHLAAISHNLSHDAEPMFERSVYYGRLTPQSIASLKQQAETQGDELLQQLNMTANKLYRQDKDNPEATQRFRMGCYWYDEEKSS
ncbi:MAG: DUF6502 family protein [Gammaproteobacteria bacterium]|nr:DUF6502 family protein [Gammaproteobacteria bacterium]